ncbi:uncharacterized protein G2W53_000919 [Senna tora]|uniref:Uncharacterized protein n=1 Tax=Senna tora TaxID=362788 RepID=A0A834XEX6_9FABA|nr:uncharacterized protein G2W53_000919 [Senna tora]
MARPLISQYLSMLDILLSSTLSLVHDPVRGIQVRLKWVNDDARGGRYGTSKEKGEIFVGTRGTTDKVDVFRVVMSTGYYQLGEVLEGNDKHQVVTRVFEKSQKIMAYFLLSHGGLNVYCDLLPSLSILVKRFPNFSTHLLYRFASEFYLLKLKLFQECLDYIVPRPQAFFNKAYVPLECKLRESEMEMRTK